MARTPKATAPKPTQAPTTVDEAVQCLRDLMPEAQYINLDIKNATYKLEVTRVTSDNPEPAE